MGIRYLFSQRELECLEFFYQKGWKQRKTGQPEEKERMRFHAAAESLNEKGFLYKKDGTIYLDKLILAFLDCMNEAERKIDFQENRLYLKQELVIWMSPDLRQKQGYALTPYRNVLDWYQEEHDQFYLDPEQLKKVLEWEEERNHGENTGGNSLSGYIKKL